MIFFSGTTHSQYNTLSFAFDLCFLAPFLLSLSLYLSTTYRHIYPHSSLSSFLAMVPNSTNGLSCKFYELSICSHLLPNEMLALAYVSRWVTGEMIGVFRFLPNSLSFLSFSVSNLCCLTGCFYGNLNVQTTFQYVTLDKYFWNV